MDLYHFIGLLCSTSFYHYMPNTAYEISTVSESIELPKSLFWDAERQTYYFIDIYTSIIHKYVPFPNEHTWAHVGDKPLSFVVPVKNSTDQFIISYGTDLALITWDGISKNISNLTIVAKVDPRPQNRINNGKTSPSGILFLGSTGGQLPSGEPEKNMASLYVYENCEIKKMLSDVSISNGMAWSADENTFYYIDTLKHKVEAYDFNSSKCCQLGNERTIFDYKANNSRGLPDGMTIDSEGKLWVTSWEGYEILRIDPATGKQLMKIDIPAAQVTCVSFGGADLEDLYVTTGSYKISKEEFTKYPSSGCLFKITGLGIKGLPDVKICTQK